MNNLISMFDLDLARKRVVIREDFNVPIANGVVLDDTRIKAALPTIKHAYEAGAAVILLSHLGRPKANELSLKDFERYSLRPVAQRLSELLQIKVRFITTGYEDLANNKNDLFATSLAASEIVPGEITLVENVRFFPGEATNEIVLAKQMAQDCDIFVMDAFATAHRAHASTVGIAQYAEVACAGPLLLTELEQLGQLLLKPKRPLLAIVGGSKVSTKFDVLEQLLTQVDHLIVGGGIANTLLAAAGYEVGTSLYEVDWIPQAKHILQANGGDSALKVPLPIDVVVTANANYGSSPEIKLVTEVTAKDAILDIGPKSRACYEEIIAAAQTIIWNGPVGVFEQPEFAAGTAAIAQAVAQNSSAFTVVGGGDTLAAAQQFKVSDKISYLSTGGGAFLEYIEGKKLPALTILEERARNRA